LRLRAGHAANETAGLRREPEAARAAQHDDDLAL
jgi:hypothetical protein